MGSSQFIPKAGGTKTRDENGKLAVMGKGKSTELKVQRSVLQSELLW